MHNICVFELFLPLLKKSFKGWRCNFTWSFGKVMCIKSLKMVFLARIIRQKLWIIYAFFDFFCSKIIFYQKNLNKTSIQWTPGSQIYLSSMKSFWSKWFLNKENQKKHKSCIIYAKFFLPQTPSSLICCTLPYQNFMWNLSLISLRFFEQR